MKYSVFFVLIITVRNYFKIKNYKICKAQFEAFDQKILMMTENCRKFSIDFSFDHLPQELKVEYNYFRGRYFLYSMDIVRARNYLKAALDLL